MTPPPFPPNTLSASRILCVIGPMYAKPYTTKALEVEASAAPVCLFRSLAEGGSAVTSLGEAVESYTCCQYV